jgi:hypothetical protein
MWPVMGFPLISYSTGKWDICCVDILYVVFFKLKKTNIQTSKTGRQTLESFYKLQPFLAIRLLYFSSPAKSATWSSRVNQCSLFYITSYQIIASSQEMGDCVSILPLFFILITFQLVFLKLFWCELFPFMFNSYI